jgi:hypothetical protein
MNSTSEPSTTPIEVEPGAQTAPRNDNGSPAPSAGPASPDSDAPLPFTDENVWAVLTDDGLTAGQVGALFERKAGEAIPRLTRGEHAGMVHRGPGSQYARLWFKGRKPDAKAEKAAKSDDMPLTTNDLTFAKGADPSTATRAFLKDRPVVVVRRRDHLPSVSTVVSNLGPKEVYRTLDDPRLVGVSFPDPELGGKRFRPKILIGLPETDLSLFIFATSTLIEIIPRPRADGPGPDYIKFLTQRDIPIVSLVANRKQWPELPAVKGLRHRAFYRPDGTLVCFPHDETRPYHYDEVSAMILAPLGDEVPVPADLSREAAQRYARELLDVFGDFPINYVGRAVILAMLITAVMREALPTAPMFFVDAPLMESGKTKLATTIAWIATGASPVTILWRSDPVEMEKTICSAILQGASFIILDNADRPVGGATIDSLVTSVRATLRELGGSNVEVSTQVTIVVTGNTLKFVGDTNSRVIGLRIEPTCKEPGKRTGFKRPFIEKWVAEHSAHLHSLVLGITEAFAHHRRPKQTNPALPACRFNEWTDFVRECVVWLGWPDPLESQLLIRKSSGVFGNI